MQEAQKVRPARAQQAKIRRRYRPHFVGPFAHRMDLANGKAPPVFPSSKKLLLNVEDLSDATCLREAASAKAGNKAGGAFQHPASPLIHDGSSRKGADAKRDGHSEE